MAAAIYAHEKLVIIRVRTKVYADDNETSQMVSVDSDFMNRNDILATLARAQFIVLQDGGTLHDEGTLLVEGVDEE